MLEENKISWSELKEVPYTNKEYKLKCPVCGNEFIISARTIEDYLTSDAHNPSEDVLYCDSCGAFIGLYTPRQLEDGSWLYCDGSYVYVKNEEGVYRIA